MLLDKSADTSRTATIDCGQTISFARHRHLVVFNITVQLSYADSYTGSIYYLLSEAGDYPLYNIWSFSQISFTHRHKHTSNVISSPTGRCTHGHLVRTIIHCISQPQWTVKPARVDASELLHHAITMFNCSEHTAENTLSFTKLKLIKGGTWWCTHNWLRHRSDSARGAAWPSIC